jgi:hypothetical protein
MQGNGILPARQGECRLVSEPVKSSHKSSQLQLAASLRTVSGEQ